MHPDGYERDHAPIADLTASNAWLAARYSAVRARTERLCAPLQVEDYVVTAMADASPAKWHLAHTTWFFETFVLKPHAPSYREHDPAFAYLFNSYYVQAGERHCRAQRGLVTRPTVAEVYAYRKHVDDAVAALLTGETSSEVVALVEIGVQHEQQHQELLITDLEYLFYANPIHPAYDAHPMTGAVPSVGARESDEWIRVPAGVRLFGHAGDSFAYDNESPRHERLLYAARISSALVTNGEYAAFIQDDGYRRPELWLSAGWATVEENGWTAPLYWERDDNAPIGWRSFTLAGMQSVQPENPVCHVSFFEADAYARWRASRDLRGARLPDEFEWEAVAPWSLDTGEASFADGAHGYRDANGFYGAVWQWTASPYVGYPGYRPVAGALGEYNGKFMADQWVLRGSSLATPPGHARITYRNFFPADARWQFTGIRLAADA